MTTFGIEWDINAIVLAKGHYDKDTVIQNPQEKWEISFEGWFPSNIYDTKPYIMGTHNIEVRIGVFESKNESKFNIDNFKIACDKFRNYWKEIIRAGEIKTDIGKTFHVLASVTSSKDLVGINYYKNIDLESQGFFKEKNFEEKDDYKRWAYSNLLDKNY